MIAISVVTLQAMNLLMTLNLTKLKILSQEIGSGLLFKIENGKIGYRNNPI